MWWQLIIVYTYGMDGMDPTKIVRRSNTEKGFEWSEVEGAGDHTYEFADSDGSWNAVYTNVIWFTEERFVDEEKDKDKEGETGQEEAQILKETRP